MLGSSSTLGRPGTRDSPSPVTTNTMECATFKRREMTAHKAVTATSAKHKSRISIIVPLKSRRLSDKRHRPQREVRSLNVRRRSIATKHQGCFQQLTAL